ncbi:hypothetical protein E4U60_005530 [Claviceps pazoutovae]|uniref:Uncharacterized protein n=1 Tax=Claviceps pazoutovae TaxID=1649127 RepID=A0A9P7SF38_9HYPO|nr:hypothetical protein E4U60_005530 [Claviceps pazoutovae]
MESWITTAIASLDRRWTLTELEIPLQGALSLASGDISGDQLSGFRDSVVLTGDNDMIRLPLVIETTTLNPRWHSHPLMLKQEPETTKILGDSQDAIVLAKNPQDRTRTKHVDDRHLVALWHCEGVPYKVPLPTNNMFVPSREAL